MNHSKGTWKVITSTAKLVGLIAWVGFGLLIRFALLPQDPKMAEWHGWQKNLFAVLIPMVVFFYALLVGYVYGDAKRRYMRYVMWTWIAALMPYFTGVILYFVVRDPLPVACPNCQTFARPGFAYCPKCGSALKRSCEGCGRPVEGEWSNCAYCGRKISAAAPPGAS